MIEQLKTIQTGLAIAIDAEGFVDKPVRRALLDAVKAAAQLEAMAGEQEPVAKLHDDGYWTPMKTEAGRALNERLLRAGSPSIEVYTTAPVAQQPQARPDFTDEWTGYLKDGETPFERFLRERKDVQSALKLYQRALEENERLKAQQPQAECRHCGGDGLVGFDWTCAVCNGTGKQPQADTVKVKFRSNGNPAELMDFAELVQPQAEAVDWKAQYEHQKRRAERWIAKYEADIGPLEKAGPVAQQPQEIEVQCPVCNHKFYEWPNDKQPQAEAVPVVDRVYEAAKRLVDHADFQLGGVLSAKSKARDIPSNAASKVKARHLASLRDALAKTPQQAEAVPPDVVRDAAPIPDHELVTMYDERPTSDLEMIEFAREVERRHGIGVQPQHTTDGSPCWCNPDVAYTDPETGASVIVHRRPQ